MTSPPREIQVKCPRCGEKFKDWFRPSINFDLGEPWSEEEVEEATSATCPACGELLDLGSLLVKNQAFCA